MPRKLEKGCKFLGIKNYSKTGGLQISICPLANLFLHVNVASLTALSAKLVSGNIDYIINKHSTYCTLNKTSYDVSIKMYVSQAAACDGQVYDITCGKVHNGNHGTILQYIYIFKILLIVCIVRECYLIFHLMKRN